ncbi:MAG: hypothetical protein LLF98_04910 [Clostridium sp.]|uniref:hypothetical protein n=1 Tax=Clostridium sp. TaxID=1506 RepID=UPI0025C37C6B|nr:hypothetical protein [Clostridium sp.]MCE5220612.1 hypothetical protein [Clostridium sp.]
MKIESIIITIVLLSTLIAKQPIEENNNTPKQPIQEISVLSSFTPNLLYKSNNKTDVLNNKSLSSKKAISNGDIVEISYLD